MKITVTVSKTVQERQYEPTSVSLTWDGMNVDQPEEVENVTKSIYHQMSDLVDELLYERTGRKVRRS